MFSGSIKQVAIQLSPTPIYFIAFCLTALIVLNGCSNEAGTPISAEIDLLAINGYDPVSYFKEGRPVRGSDEFATTWNDAKYHFSCQENLDLFKTNPEKYAPQYDGYCAFAMSRGDYSRIDPGAFAIVDDKLYLTYNRDIKNAWLQDKENYINKADRIWKDSRFNNN